MNKSLLLNGESLLEIIGSVSDGIQILDSELRYLYLNKACIVQARMPEEVLIGNKMTDVYPDIINTELYRKILSTIKEKKRDEFINEFTYPDGEKRWFLLKLEPYKEGIIIISTDITRFRKQEDEIIRLNRLLRSIRDINQLIVREKDRKKMINAACKILIQSDIFRSAAIILLKEKDIEYYSVYGDNRLLFNIGENLSFENLPDCIRKSYSANIMIITENDTEFCSKCSLFSNYCKDTRTIVLPVSYGMKNYGILLCILNPDNKISEEIISLLKEICGDIGFSINTMQIEEKLGKSIQMFEYFSDNINSILLLLDQHNNIIYANHLIRNFGFDNQDLTGKQFLDIIVSNEKDIVTKALSEIKQGKIAQYEIHLTDHQKRILTFRCKGRMLINEKGEPVTIMILDNITEHKLMEQQMLTAQKLESIGRLAGGIAHDFNNILSVILNYADFSMQEIDKNTPLYEDIRKIKTAAIKASALSNQLLSISRKQIMQVRPVDLNKAIDNIVGLLKRIIDENIILNVIYSPKTKPVLIDPGHFDQILMNLIVNARDAMPKGGKLTISTDSMFLSEDYKSIKFNLKSGEYSVVIVSDTGIGMDQSILSRVFEPFFTTKEQGKGTGLGLATVYGLVRQYGGDIFVYSEVERGSTFKIYLPAIKDTEIIQEEEKIPVNLNGDETILLVEDDPMVRDITLRILKDAGYRVLSASSPNEAIAIASVKQNDIDLLLSDVIMPGMNGVELSRILCERIPDLKILLMSGYTEEALSNLNLSQSSINLIQKPFDSVSLRKKIREVLNQ